MIEKGKGTLQCLFRVSGLGFRRQIYYETRVIYKREHKELTARDCPNVTWFQHGFCSTNSNPG